MSAYVICAECGARIKADREYCLRCGEPLRGLEPPAPPLPLHEALGVSELTFRALSVVASIIVGAGLVWLWQARPQPAIDEIAQPLNPTGVPRSISPPPAPPSDADPFTAASPGPPSAPGGTSLDARRDGRGSFAA